LERGKGVGGVGGVEAWGFGSWGLGLGVGICFFEL